MDLIKLNLDLCRALGVQDAEHTTSVTLEIGPGHLPRVTARRALMSADGLQTAVEVLHLKPTLAEA